MPPTDLIRQIFECFRPEFTPRTWPRVITLIFGTILARGRRTVAAALRQMGLHDDPNFSSYHQVFNRAAWSPRKLARRLLTAAIASFVPEGVGLTFAIDETLERRWGRKIRIRGHYRDPLGLQQGTLGLRQRHPLDRPGPGRHRPLGQQALGPADPQPALPDPQGQPQAGATPQDHRRAGPPDDRLPPPLAV